MRISGETAAAGVITPDVNFMEDIKKADTGDFWTNEHTYKTVDISIMNWFISNYAWLRLNSYMLITLIFYGSEHIGQWVKISVTINGSVCYKCIYGFGDMLIGSEIPQVGMGPNLQDITLFLNIFVTIRSKNN